MNTTNQSLKTLPPPLSEADVVKILNSHNVPLHLWGSGSYRSLVDFLKYLKEDRFLIRPNSSELVVDVYSVIVIVTYKHRNRWLELYEERQVFPDGTVLQRSFNGIAETLKRKESLLEGATRCLGEELNFWDTTKYTILPEYTVEHRDPVPSEKWPGVKSSYHRHIFECEIFKSIFRKKGYVEKEGKRSIHFKWKPRGQEHFNLQ